MSMQPILAWCVAGMASVLMFACGAQAFGADEPAEGEVLARVHAAFARQYPATTLDRVRVTPIAGLYELTAGRNVFYTDVHARYVLFGSLFDVHTQTDLSMQAKAAPSRIEWSALPLDAALIHRHGSGARQLAVFADPQCPHCRALQQRLNGLKNVTVYTFIVPMLGEQSESLARSVWCARDPAQAWLQVMRSNSTALGRGDVAPETGAATACDTPEPSIKRFVDAHGIAAVPTLINQNGEVLRGAPSAEQLESFLGERG